MKFIIFFCLIFASCSQEVPQKAENSSQPVLEVSSTPNSSVEKDLVSGNSAIEIENPRIIEQTNRNQSYLEQIEKTENPSVLPTLESENESWEQYLKEELIELSKNSQLTVLEKSKIPQEDLEIRVWQNSGWRGTNIFTLKRSNGKWTANLQKQTFREGTLKLKKMSKDKLSEPNSGWESFWRKLTEEELLTLPDGFENKGSVPCPDCGNIIVETNTGGNYRWYLYTTPSSKSALRETRQVAKIANIIAQEFRIEEFNTPKSSE